MDNFLNHEIDISTLQPPVVKDTLEFQEISRVENKNLNEARLRIIELFNNRFVNYADEIGITRWEKVLKLTRKRSDTLEERRQRVLTKINNRLPYTIRALKQLLNSLITEDSYKLRLDPVEYELYIDLYADIKDRKFLNSSLEEMLPMNLLYEVARIIENIIQVKVKSYDFEVLYPICNMFATSEMPGVMTKINAAVTQSVYDFESSYRVTNEFTTEGYEARTNIQNETTLKVEAYYVPYIRLGENELGDGLRLGGYVDDEETNQTRVLMRANSEDSTVTYKRTNEINLGEVEL